MRSIFIRTTLRYLRATWIPCFGFLLSVAPGFAEDVPQPITVHYRSGGLGVVTELFDDTVALGAAVDDPAFNRTVDHVVYHDQTHNEHQAMFDRWVSEGLRMVSLSAYGDPGNARYAAVWVRQSGPPWLAFHGSTAAEYQTLVEAQIARGYHPRILTATGSGGRAIFAGTFERAPDSARVPLTRHLLRSGSVNDTGTIEHWNRWAFTNDFIPFWFDSYGSGDQVRFTGVWVPNQAKTLWASALLESSSEYQERFNAQRKQWARPSLVMVSGDHRFSSVFVDNVIGPWVARHNLSASSLAQEIQTWHDRGYLTCAVQGGSDGRTPRFSALFAKSDQPVARRWNTTGRSVQALASFDDAMQTFMQNNNIRAGSLAVVRGTRLVYARGYTWAEPGYPITQPTSMFRIASLSKPVTSIATHQAIARGDLALTDEVQSILGLTRPDGSTAPADGRIDDVTVLDLLTHSSGWGNITYDYEVAGSYANRYPVTKYQRAQYHMSFPLSFQPGARNQYSNFGYSILGLVLERVSRPDLSYEAIVRRDVFNPLGLTRPFVAGTVCEARRPGEVRYHDYRLRVVTNVMHQDRRLLPMPYGGEHYRTFDSFGGWVLSAPDYAKLLAAFNRGAYNPLMSEAMQQEMWSAPASLNQGMLRGWFTGMQNGVRVFGHGGSIPGVETRAEHREDGISFVAFFNRNGPDYGPFNVVNELHRRIDQVSSWPQHDLFPEMGIPRFIEVVQLGPPSHFQVNEWGSAPTPWFTLSRAGSDASVPLTVHLQRLGSARADEDYAGVPSAVTLPPGLHSIQLCVHPLSDGKAEGDERVDISLAERTHYEIETPRVVSVLLRDKPSQAWKASWFTAEERLDEAYSGDQADADGDGRVNAVEYALGTSPKVQDSAHSYAELLDAETLSFTYTRRKEAEDVTFAVYVHDDLSKPWPLDPEAAAEEVIHTDRETETVRVRCPIPEGALKHYMKVAVSIKD